MKITIDEALKTIEEQTDIIKSQADEISRLSNVLLQFISLDEVEAIKAQK